MQAFGEGLVSARVGRFNKFGVYCGAAGGGQLSFELCGPDVDADAHTSTLHALSDNQVYVLPATLDKEAGVVLVNYQVRDRGMPCTRSSHVSASTRARAHVLLYSDSPNAHA